jgi:hypothetical protein
MAPRMQMAGAYMPGGSMLPGSMRDAVPAHLQAQQPRLMQAPPQQHDPQQQHFALQQQQQQEQHLHQQHFALQQQQKQMAMQLQQLQQQQQQQAEPKATRAAAKTAARAPKVSLTKHHATAPAKPGTRFFTLELNFWVLCALIIIVALLILCCTTHSRVASLTEAVDRMGTRVMRLENVIVHQHSALRAMTKR